MEDSVLCLEIWIYIFPFWVGFFSIRQFAVCEEACIECAFCNKQSDQWIWCQFNRSMITWSFISYTNLIIWFALILDLKTALMQACRYGHWEVAQTLLLFRCNVSPVILYFPFPLLSIWTFYKFCPIYYSTEITWHGVDLRNYLLSATWLLCLYVLSSFYMVKVDFENHWTVVY